MSYYKFIDGIRYSRDLLEAADRFTTGQREGRLSYDEIQQIYRLAEDGRRITDTERRTLIYIGENYTLTPKALEWLQTRLKSPSGGHEVYQTIARVVREEYGLKNLGWQIEAEEVARQETMGRSRFFESALRGALDAFLRWNQGQLSLAAFVRRRNLTAGEYPTSEDLLKIYLDRGTLILVPIEEAQRAKLEIDLPEGLDFNTYWIFLLHIPKFFPALFIAYVLRDNPYQFSKGYFSQRPEPEELIFSVVRQFAGFNTLEWKIDWEEVQRQLALQDGQNFGNALFAALNGGIFNGESSFSFRDFIRDEVWKDPDLEWDHYLHQYIETGTLHLIPLDYRRQTDPGTVSFPLPGNFSPWMEGEWLFGLEMPRKTHVRFLINTPRENDDGETGWNDGFILEDLSFDGRLQSVLEEEFDLPDLKLTFPEAEFETQREQFGPDWRHAPGLLRQALHTAMDDYLTRESVFYIVSEVHRDEANPEQFITPLEYRAAVRQRIHGYLKTGSLEFLRAGIPDDLPPNGETVEENWLFSLRLPALSDHSFYIVIPRWPDDEQRPYVYGVN